MSLSTEHQRREAAERDAIAWLLRLDAPDAAEGDWLALQAWLEADPENLAAYDRAERVSVELAAASTDLVRGLDSRFASQRRRPMGRRFHAPAVVWRATAGLAAAAAAAVLFVAIQPQAPAPTEVFQTAKGQNRLINLADGSRVHLNSGSRLTVRLERKTRYVELAEGEAAFDVAKDAARPFLIAAGERSIRVVGTEFEVLRHDGRLRVTVRRGVVAVQSPYSVGPTGGVLLRAGDQLDHQPGARISTVRRVDPDVAFAWRGGDLVYRDQPLGEVVEDLNRYFVTPVKVTGPAADLRFSGVLVIDGQDAMVRRLQAFLPLSVDRAGDGMTLRMRDAAR